MDYSFYPRFPGCAGSARILRATATGRWRHGTRVAQAILRTPGAFVYLFLACAHHIDVEPLVAQPGADDDVVAIATVGGRLFLVGKLPTEASGPWATDGSFPTGWSASTNDTDPGMPVGSRWTVGDATCAVAGYSAVVVEFSESDPGPSPSCGSPNTWAELSCDQVPTVDIAVPYGTTRPVFGQLVGTADTAGALPLVEALSRWSEALTEAHADATARDVAVEHVVSANRYRLGVRSVLVIDATVMSGDGQNYCGGDDVFRRLLLVTTDDPHPTVLGEYWRDDYAYVHGLVDVDGDGIPSLRLGVMDENTLGDRQLGYVSSCVCGC